MDFKKNQSGLGRNFYNRMEGNFYNRRDRMFNYKIPAIYKKQSAMLIAKAMFNIVNYIEDNLMLNGNNITENDVKMLKSSYIFVDDDNAYSTIAKLWDKELHLITRVNVINIIQDSLSKISELFNVNLYEDISPKVNNEFRKYNDLDEMKILELDLRHKVNINYDNSISLQPQMGSVYRDIQPNIDFVKYFYRRFVNNLQIFMGGIDYDDTFRMALITAKCFYYSILLIHSDELYNQSMQNAVNSLSNKEDIANSDLYSKLLLSKKIFRKMINYGYISPFNIINSYGNINNLIIVSDKNNLFLPEDLKTLLYSVIVLSVI